MSGSSEGFYWLLEESWIWDFSSKLEPVSWWESPDTATRPVWKFSCQSCWSWCSSTRYWEAWSQSSWMIFCSLWSSPSGCSSARILPFQRSAGAISSRLRPQPIKRLGLIRLPKALNLGRFMSFSWWSSLFQPELCGSPGLSVPYQPNLPKSPSSSLPGALSPISPAESFRCSGEFVLLSLSPKPRNCSRHSRARMPSTVNSACRYSLPKFCRVAFWGWLLPGCSPLLCRLTTATSSAGVRSSPRTLLLPLKKENSRINPVFWSPESRLSVSDCSCWSGGSGLRPLSPSGITWHWQGRSIWPERSQWSQPDCTGKKRAKPEPWSLCGQEF